MTLLPNPVSNNRVVLTRTDDQKISLNTPVRVSKPTIKIMAMIHRIIFMRSPSKDNECKEISKPLISFIQYRQDYEFCSVCAVRKN